MVKTGYPTAHDNPREQSSLGVIHCLMERYIRIDRAKELLDFTDKSIAEIAEASGFSNQNYFTRTFKKITGMTPSHYRKTGEHKNSFLPD